MVLSLSRPLYLKGQLRKCRKLLLKRHNSVPVNLNGLFTFGLLLYLSPLPPLRKSLWSKVESKVIVCGRSSFVILPASIFKECYFLPPSPVKYLIVSSASPALYPSVLSISPSSLSPHLSSPPSLSPVRSPGLITFLKRRSSWLSWWRLGLYRTWPMGSVAQDADDNIQPIPGQRER